MKLHDHSDVWVYCAAAAMSLMGSFTTVSLSELYRVSTRYKLRYLSHFYICELITFLTCNVMI